MTSLLRIFSVLFALVLLACAKPVETVSKPTEREGKLPSAFIKGEYYRDVARFAPTDETRRDISVKSYDLKGQFDWERRELTAVVEMKLRLMCACQESFVIDSQVEEIKSIVLKNTGQSLGHSISGRDLSIDLSQIPEEIRKQELAVAISYRAKANQKGNGDPTSLVAVDRVAGDPLKSRMVYTFSEPQDASLWMPCLNDPSYRAQFSVELKMPPSQMLIANGDLVRNEIENGSRWVKYQTRYTLPTYLMAFAQGEISVTTEYHGALPVSIVTRTGLRADVHGLLKETIRQIKHFESLLVPYPFEKYMIVLAPEFASGGIEHAGITFNDETSSSQSLLSRDVGLMSHELGHQWFGDLVTVKTWDDLWIKEGMASLLGEEAMRPFEDKNATGRLMGHDQSVEEGDAIYDPSLKPDDKYTSGPYGRAAWLLTQIRGAIGEDAFWGALRKVLTDYRFNSIGTDEFLEYFRPAGGNALVDKIRKAIHAKAMPALKTEVKEGVFHLTLEDKEGALLLPVELSWFSDVGAIETEVLTHGKTVNHLVNDVRLLTLDLQDLHPLENFAGWNKLSEIIDPLMAPRTEAQLKRFFTLGGHAHQRAMSEKSVWKFTAKEVKGIYENLHSEYAKYEFLALCCGMAKKAESTTQEAWRGEISKVLLAPPYLGIPVRGSEGLLGACSGFMKGEVFSSLWAQIEAYPGSTELSELELYFASLLPRDTAKAAFRTWARVSNEAASVRARTVGLQNLLRHLYARTGYVEPTGPELETWEKHFLELLNSNRTGKFLNLLLPAVEKFKSPEFMPGLASIIRGQTFTAWKTAYCVAHSVGKENAEAKKVFEAALGDITTLPRYIQDLVKDPKACERRE